MIFPGNEAYINAAGGNYIDVVVAEQRIYTQFAKVIGEKVVSVASIFGVAKK